MDAARCAVFLWGAVRRIFLKKRVGCVVAMLRHLWAVPFADEEQRREYMRDYHAEFRVGLKD